MDPHLGRDVPFRRLGHRDHVRELLGDCLLYTSDVYKRQGDDRPLQVALQPYEQCHQQNRYQAEPDGARRDPSIACLLYTSWAAVLADRTPLREFLALAETLVVEPADERDPDVWGQITGALSLMYRAVPDSAIPDLRAYTRALVGPVFEQLCLLYTSNFWTATWWRGSLVRMKSSLEISSSRQASANLTEVRSVQS